MNTHTKSWLKRSALLLALTLAPLAGCATTNPTVRPPESAATNRASPSPRAQAAIPPQEFPQQEMTNPAD